MINWLNWEDSFRKGGVGVLQHMRKGPQEFEASIDRITLEAGNKFTLHLGKGTYPEYLQDIYLPCFRTITTPRYAEEIAELFKQGHNVEVGGEYTLKDYLGEFDSRIPGLTTIYMIEAIFVSESLGHVYNAQIIVKDKDTGEVIVTRDLDFQYFFRKVRASRANNPDIARFHEFHEAPVEITREV